MHKTILLGLLLAGSLTASADDYQYLTAAYAGVEQSVELATIQKITFENSNVVIYTTDGTLTFAQSDMERIFFAATPTAIDALPSESDAIRLEDGQLHVKGLTGRLYIYGVNGQLQHVAQLHGDATVSLAPLPHGVYIVKAGSQTIKIRK